MKKMKHAYLIMAHNDFYILEKLLEILDDDSNDFFIHIDKKVKNFDFNKVKAIAKKSKVFFSKRSDIRWGRDSQIKCELSLLKIATYYGKYDYYHLLSGVDLPLKNVKYINAFFEKNKGKEFIHYHTHKNVDENKLTRVKYYHCFNKNIRSDHPILQKISTKCYYNFLKLEKLLKINRIKGKENDFYHGANWFSITDDLAKFILSNSKKIKKDYKFTFCADEIFLQTIVVNSPFYHKLYLKKDDDYRQIMRFIDWNRGEPYTFKEEDFQLLMSSDYLFARKFSTKVDKNIIDKIYNSLMSDK